MLCLSIMETSIFLLSVFPRFIDTWAISHEIYITLKYQLQSLSKNNLITQSLLSLWVRNNQEMILGDSWAPRKHLCKNIIFLHCLFGNHRVEFLWNTKHLFHKNRYAQNSSYWMYIKYIAITNVQQPASRKGYTYQNLCPVALHLHLLLRSSLVVHVKPHTWNKHHPLPLVLFFPCRPKE